MNDTIQQGEKGKNMDAKEKALDAELQSYGYDPIQLGRMGWKIAMNSQAKAYEAKVKQLDKIVDILRMTQSDNIERAKFISAPEDQEIRLLCERIGYGAVMDSVARQWQKKDPVGAFACGPCMGTIEAALKVKP